MEVEVYGRKPFKFKDVVMTYITYSQCTLNNGKSCRTCKNDIKSDIQIWLRSLIDFSNGGKK